MLKLLKKMDGMKNVQHEGGCPGSRMMQFAQVLPDFKIVSTVSTQISWSHVIEILPLNGELQREFYLTLAASERWSVRRLRKEIDSMLFERTAMFFLNRKKMKFHFKNRNISFNLSNSPI